MSGEQKELSFFHHGLTVLNLADILLTLVMTYKLGLDSEGNPLMRAAIGLSPLFFCTLKIFVVGMLASWLARHSAIKTLSFATGAYAAVVAMHANVWLNQ